VARTAGAFPLILDMLDDGRLNLATVRALASRLTQENHQELLAAAARKSRRQVDELVAHRFPQPDVPSLIRKLPTPAAHRPNGVAPPAAAVDVPAWAPAPPPDSSRQPAVKPLAPDRYQIRFTASAGTRDKLMEAQDLLRHAGLQREVAKRDDERCAYVSPDGRRCNARAYAQFHHVDPHAIRGEATVERTELRCRAHNEYEAELFYGRPWRERATRPGTSAPSRLLRDQTG
jgi:hypothetical protein